MLMPIPCRGQIPLSCRAKQDHPTHVGRRSRAFYFTPWSAGRRIGIVIGLSFVEQRALAFVRASRFFQMPESLQNFRTFLRGKPWQFRQYFQLAHGPNLLIRRPGSSVIRWLELGREGK